MLTLKISGGFVKKYPDKVSNYFSINGYIIQDILNLEIAYNLNMILRCRTIYANCKKSYLNSLCKSGSPRETTKLTEMLPIRNGSPISNSNPFRKEQIEI